GHTAKTSTTPKCFIREIRDADVDGLEVGQVVHVDEFATGEIVDVTGNSKDTGFQRFSKRHGQSRGPMSHSSRSHR
ncbi:50S ribosomal protein L3, partial [Bacillus paranthracis]|nr:50S ribosomal protein L3 [Bacillus paranthracis]